MSEQIQGGLFDEKPTELSTADIHGQSQTPEARYARNYRKNPENKKRINENRRKNRQMKKDQESRLSLVLESAAHPIKAEQQTIEHPLKKSDSSSLADSQGKAKHKADLNAELIAVLRDGFDRLDRNIECLHSEIKSLKECIKPAAPALPDDKNSEQQVATMSEKVTNKKTNLKRFVERLPTLGISLLILTFLGFNYSGPRF